MPHMDGLQGGKNVRNADERPAEPYVYIILLTAKPENHMVTGLEGRGRRFTKPSMLKSCACACGLAAHPRRWTSWCAREIMREQSGKDSLAVVHPRHGAGIAQAELERYSVISGQRCTCQWCSPT